MGRNTGTQYYMYGLPSTSLESKILTIDNDGLLYYTTSSVFFGNTNIDTSSFVRNSQTSSFITNSQTSSFVTYLQTGSFATTGSNVFNGNQTITGSLIVTSEFTLDETLTKFAKYTNVGVGVINNVTLFTIPTGSYTSAFGKYTIYSGSNSRAGELMTSRNGTMVNSTDVATNDIGTTSVVRLTSQVSESYYQIIASFPATGTWDIKMMATYI
jgi:hypothetical protein